MTKRPEKARKDSRLKLTTPRRNWKRFDSVVQHRFKGRAVNISRDAARGTVGSRNYRPIRPNGAAFDGKDSEALKWIQSMIERGRSILSSQREEERAFQVEIEEGERRISVHDRLVENILAREDEETSRNGYGTDTSFKNINNALYNSFVDSEDVKLDYSRDEDNGKLTGSPDAPTMPVGQSPLQSELFGEPLDYAGEEHSDINVSSNYSPQESANEVVEVLSSSEESQLDQVDTEVNYKSEDKWDEDISEEVDEQAEISSDEEQGSVRQLSNLDEAGHESQRDDEGMQFSDEEEILPSLPNRKEENEQNFEVLSNEEASDDYSSELDQDDRGSGALSPIEHTNENLSEHDLNHEAFPADISESNQRRGSSSSSSACYQSQSFSSEAHRESSQDRKSSSIEADDFAELDNIDIVGNQESNQHVDASSTVDHLHDESSHFISDEENQRVIDAFDYRIIAQEARISATLEKVEPSMGLKEDTISCVDEKADDDEAHVADETDSAHEEQAYTEDLMTAVSKDASCNARAIESNTGDMKLDLNNHSPNVIEVEINDEVVEEQRDEEPDNSENDRSSTNETTIYHSFNSIPDETPETQYPSQNDHQEDSRYQIVFAGSAYSTTSYEDNSNIVEPLRDYISPLAENPFSVRQDEDAYQILRRTLASLSKETEDQNSDKTSRSLEKSDEKTPVPDTITLNASPNQNVGVDQEAVPTEYPSNNDISDHLKRSNEEEVSDYVTAVFETSKKMASSSECETSVVAVEEIESDAAMTSLPIIQTGPSIEVAESTPESFPQQIFYEEVQTATNVVSESVEDSDSSEDGLSNVIQTRPIVETPSFDGNDAKSHDGMDFSAEQHTSERTSPPETQEDDSKRSESVSAAVIPCETGSADDQESAFESQASSSAASDSNSGQNSHKITIETDCAYKLRPDSTALSLPKRLLSSPLRAISSLVSGIKEVGNAASDFVKTLDVLDREDSDEQPDSSIEDRRISDDDKNCIGMNENMTVPDATERELQKSEDLQYLEGQDVNKTSNVNDFPSKEDGIYVASSAEQENPTVEETVIHDVIDEVERFQVIECDKEDETYIEENQLGVDVRDDTRGPCTANEGSVAVDQTDDEQSEQRQEKDDREDIDLTDKEDIKDPQQSTNLSSCDATESARVPPAAAHKTISHIRALQELAENVYQTLSTPQDQTENSDLQTEEIATVDKVVNVEVDPEIEIYLERPSQDQSYLESNLIPPNEAYPAESTVIGVTSLQKDSRLMGPNPQEIEQDPTPPPLLHDHATDRLPSYLPSDPPSESEDENAVEPAESVEDPTSAKQSDDQLQSRPESIGHDDPDDCYIVDQSADEDVKSIPVESADSGSDVQVPVVLEGRPPLELEGTPISEEEAKSSTGEPVNAGSSKKIKSSSAKQPTKRKRPHDDANDVGRRRKKNKRQLKGKRKGKKKSRIPSRKL